MLAVVLTNNNKHQRGISGSFSTMSRKKQGTPFAMRLRIGVCHIDDPFRMIQAKKLANSTAGRSHGPRVYF